MPRIRLIIDGQGHMIDTPSHETAGRWFAEVLGNYRILDTSWLQLQISPFYVPDPRGLQFPYVPDWNSDSRYLDQHSIGGVSSRAEAIRKFVRLLTEQADKFEEMDGKMGDYVAPPLVRVVQTCMAAPAEWDAWDAEGQYYYLRYRHGRGTVERAESKDTFLFQPSDRLVSFDTGDDHAAADDLPDFLRYAGLTLAPDADVKDMTLEDYGDTLG